MFVPFMCLIFIVSNSTGQDCTQTRCKIQATELRFFIIGDWGGLFWYPYYSYAQKTIAETLGEQAVEFGTHFQVSLGDNFYAVGVKNVEDPRFQKTFEDIYPQPALQTPWYSIMGNHDHYGNTSAQIAYTKRSSRWKLPALYYTVKYETSDGATVDMIMIDTIVLCGKAKDIQFSESSYDWMFGTKQELGVPESEEAAEAEWTWIEEQLRQSEADYLFITGHYPILSIGDHGPVDCLKDRLTDLMAQYNAQVYMSGHDHNLQHLHIDKGEWRGHQIISGAGGFIHESREFADAVPEGSLQFDYPGKDCTGDLICFENPLKKIGFTRGGFAYAEVNKEKATFYYMRGDGEIQYNFEIQPRNSERK